MKTIKFAFNEDIFLIYSCVEFGIFDTEGASGVGQNVQVDFWNGCSKCPKKGKKGRTRRFP